MRRSLTVGLFLLLVAPAFAGPKKPDYHTHRDTTGYTVIFPDNPRESIKEIASPGGNLSVETQRVEFNGVMYSVTFTEYPDTFGEVPAEKLIDGVRDGMKGADGKVTKDEKIDLEGIVGREIVIDAGKKNAVRVRVYLTKRKLYQVMLTGPKDAIGDKDSVDGKNATDFLKSFKWYK